MSADGLRLAALVLAAGRSRRMGLLKQTLPWPAGASRSETFDLKSQLVAHARAPAPGAATATVISSAFDAIAPFCSRMFVVVGRDADAVLTALEGRLYTRVDADSDEEMFASIRAGLRAVIASDEHAAAPFDAVMLQPGDHPGVARATIEALLARFGGDRTRAAMPEHNGMGGHPAVLPLNMAGAILDYPGGGGLRQFWLDHPDRRVRIAVDDPSCIVDIDTPAAYVEAVSRRQSKL